MAAWYQAAHCSWGRPSLVCRRNSSKAARFVCRAGASQQPQCIGMAMSAINTNVSVWQIPDSPQFPPEVRKSRVLMIDDSGNLHSVYREDQVLTGAYWDCLALLPALVPDGPLAILGLGAGTIAHLVHAYYPERILHGWELDPAVISMAEEHMGMRRLTSTGSLVVHVGDALAGSARVEPAGATGIIVDLFAHGQLIPQLTQASSWCSIRQRLAPGGRVMTNLGAAPVPGLLPGRVDPQTYTTRQALAAMAEAFEGQITCCSITVGATANMVVVTGPPISSQGWAAAPADLKQYTQMAWEPYSQSARR